MGRMSLLDMLRAVVSKYSWRIFLWSIQMTGDEYRTEIYNQEKAYLEN